MELKLLKFRTIKSGTGKLLGTGDVQIGDVLVLRSIMLFDGKDNKPFISPPKTESNGKYYENGYSFCWENKKMTPGSTKLSADLLDILYRAYQDANDNGSKPAGKTDNTKGYF